MQRLQLLKRPSFCVVHPFTKKEENICGNLTQKMIEVYHGSIRAMRVLANMEESIGQVLKRTKPSTGFILDKTSSPPPNALVQIASLAIRTGNGLLLKGGKEARRSNAILHKVITSAIP